MSAAPETDSDSLEVRWSDVVRFVRQLSHDLRNHLNAVELQSAFLAELATDSETKDEIKRLRQMISEVGASLQNLTSNLGLVKTNLIAYPASNFIQDLRAKIGNDFPDTASQVEWDFQGEDREMQIDPLLLEQALVELFKNAFEHARSDGKLGLVGKMEGDAFQLTLHEPKTKFDLPMQNWAREPLRHLNRGHYGLGLNRVRVIVEAHGGELQARYNSAASELVTTVRLPVSPN